MTLDIPEPDERLQIVYCVGCEQASLLGDCESGEMKRLRCPECGTVVVPDSIWDYIETGVTDHE